MTIPMNLDFPCWRNADYNEEFTVTVNGVPVDLTGMSAIMHVRDFPTSPDLRFSVVPVFVDRAGGVIRISIPLETLRTAYGAVNGSRIPSDIINLSHDIRFVYPDGIREIWMQGIVSINPGVVA